ncbi:MAG TPA: cation-translocating P-type ATPase, partial [Thermodesulfobacteriota bacterium]|nr:cation-translocating P-type ATPase [Thermodesulfobacteriota bacterium]
MNQAPAAEFCHSVPGRLRVKVAAIRRQHDKAGALANWLTLQQKITQAHANPITGSVILEYDPQVAQPEELYPLLEQAVVDLPRLLDETPPWSGLPLTEIRVEDGEALTWGVAKVAGITGFFGLNLLMSFLGAPFSSTVIAGAAVLASLPLWRQALLDFGQYRLVGLNPLMSTAAIMAIAAGEAMTALEVVWILEIGRLLEEYVTDRSRRAIKEILQVAAKNTYILVQGTEVETPVNQVREGDIVVVRAMERISVDGVIVQGEALVDMSHITGRSAPDLRRLGDTVFSGTIVQDGSLQIRAEKVGEATYLAQIIHIVEQSLLHRPRAEKQAELLAIRLSRLSFGATVATIVLTRDLSRIFAVLLVMACPCATVLAASTAVSASLANAADHLMLVKGGVFLERFSETDCFCFDKTGTVTKGIPEVREVHYNHKLTNFPELLGLAASAEFHNPHPLGKALVKKAQEEDYNLINDALVENVLGRGVRAAMGVNTVLVGNRAFMIEEDVATTGYQAAARKLEGKGQTVVYVAKNGTLLGIVGISTAIREELDEVMTGLRRLGVKEFHLVSGDTPRAVKIVAEGKGFDGYAGDLLPEEKAAYVAHLAERGLTVTFVGDGVNDAPALTKAEVGVAMGAGGSETAIATADIALVDD